MSGDGGNLKIAVVGAGLIGERHARLIAGSKDCSLHSIIDPAERAGEIASGCKSAWYEDLARFLGAAADCDGVVIATPNETHRDIALECIASRLPALVEKPLAADSTAAAAIVEAAERENIPVLVGHHRRHHEVSHLLKAIMSEGELGDIVGAQLVWALRKPDEYFAAGDWRVQPGGGPVWINLIHEIDLLRYFIGEIVQVSAILSKATRNSGVEDSGAVSLKFANGAIASVLVSDCAPSPWHFEGASGENPNIARTGEDSLRIFGTRGSVSFPSLTVWKHADKSGHWGSPIHAQKEVQAASMDGEVALSNQLENFCAVIRGVAKPLVTARDGLQTVRVVEAIHQAAKTGETVKVEQTQQHVLEEATAT